MLLHSYNNKVTLNRGISTKMPETNDYLYIDQEVLVIPTELMY